MSTLSTRAPPLAAGPLYPLCVSWRSTVEKLSSILTCDVLSSKKSFYKVNWTSVLLVLSSASGPKSGGACL